MSQDVISELKILLYAAFVYLNIETETFAILLGFMCLDSIVGAIKAIRMGNEFNFKTLMVGFILKLCILIIPLIVALLGKTVGYDFTQAVNLTMIILNVSEGYSILGNIYSAKNKVEVKKIDVISILLMSLRKALKNIMYLAISKIENIGKK